MFTQVFHGILPGGLEYLHIRKPGAAQPYGMQIAHASHGKEIETGSVENGDYFRLHVNEQNCVETITCVVNGEQNHGVTKQ